MQTPYLSVIIPAYNEEDRIEKTLKRVHEYLSAQSYSWEVLVVLDGSTDRTPEVASAHKAKFGGRLKITGYPENKGKGRAVRTGMLEAQVEYCIFTDADNSTDIHYLEALLQKFKEGYEVVISTRDKKDAAGAGQAIPQNWFKRQ